MTSATTGTTIASITVGTTMAATVIAGYTKHGHDKHGRGKLKAGLYLYFDFVIIAILVVIFWLVQYNLEVPVRSA